MSVLQRIVAANRVALVALVAMLSPLPAVSASTCRTFDLPAMVSPVEAHLIWMPLLASLAQRTGICFVPYAVSDLAAVDERLGAGLPDFAVVIPTALIHAQRRQAYRPLLASSIQQRVLVVVRWDSPLTEVSAMRRAGKVSLGVAAGHGLMLSHAPQQFMTRSGVDCRLVELSRPPNVLREVVVGHIQAGAITDWLLSDRPDLAARVRPVWTSAPFLPPPLVAHPRVSRATGDAIRAALIDMGADASGSELLRRAGLAEPVAKKLEDYRTESRRLYSVGSRCPGE